MTALQSTAPTFDDVWRTIQELALMRALVQFNGIPLSCYGNYKKFIPRELRSPDGTKRNPGIDIPRLTPPPHFYRS